MEIKKYTNSAWTDLGEPMKAFYEYTDTAMSLPLTIQTSSVNAVENYKVYGASGGVGDKTINKFNKEAPWYRENRYYNSAGSAASTENWNISGPISVKPNTTYTLYYGTQASNPSLCEFDSNDTKINIVSYNSAAPCTFTTSADTSYIQASIRKTHIDTAYLIEDDEALENFVPYGYEILIELTYGAIANTIYAYLGDTQLNEDEYIDYKTQKVYKRTANFLNFDELITAPSGALVPSQTIVDHVLAMQFTPSTDYTLYSDGQGSESGDADENRSVYFGGTGKPYTAFNNHPVTINSGASGVIYIGIISSRTNAQQYINGTAHLWILEGSDAQGDYVPYYSPVDPPLPFPAVETTIGKTEVDVNTTTAPEKVVLEYKGWKQAGDGEVKYRHNNEWTNSAPPAKPSWLADGYESVLDAQTAPSNYYCDLAYIENNVQFVYRVYVASDTVCRLEKSSNYLSVFQYPYSGGYTGFTTYCARYNGSSWFLASSDKNQDRGKTAYANNTSQRAILSSTITDLTNTSGYTFEDFR